MAGLSLRRTRLTRHLRELARSVQLDRSQLIQPLFAVAGLTEREPVPGIDAVYRDTPASLLRQIEEDLAAGIDKFLLFAVPGEKRDQDFEHDFAVECIEEIKQGFGTELWLAVDVCLCSHTTHGHCGLLNEAGDYVINDATVAELARAAAAFAAAGADCVAPSDMMDGRVAAIRTALDQAGLARCAIMSYAAKFQSQFYGPFRDAADSAPVAPQLRDRASYQLDPARPADALRCARRDADEGADLLMVKPGLPYLDVLARLSAEIPLPWAVYQVSGEQAAIDLLAHAGLAKRDAAQLESWLAFRRAGATAIISYAARRGVALQQ
ncbi:MAG: porphobilinogen synthase [Gammaproteobacteria bacterium]|nr:MAG: porphobilinogen synthase [Gammaproteobacteria bacterium]